jgi:hypothetical protein
MKSDVVDMTGKSRPGTVPPFVSDFWFAQIDARLNQIEFVMGRIERQIWVIVIAVLAVLSIEVIQALLAPK